MKLTSLSLIAVSALSMVSPSFAQLPVHGTEERVSTRVAWLRGVARPVEVRIDYGAAAWRPDYEREVAAKRERVFRLGGGGWATLHTGAELRVGKRRLPAGIWYLALHRDADAKWSLAVFESAKVLRHGILPSSVQDLSPALLVPMARKGVATGIADGAAGDVVAWPKLGVQLLGGETGAPGMGAQPGSEPSGETQLQIAWGSHYLSGSFEVAVEVAETAARPAFQKLDPERAWRTASGLGYEVLRDGVGAAPDRTSKVTVHYVGWLADGTQFDSSIDRGSAATFGLNQVIEGWAEGLQLMNPGAVLLLEIPPKLAYGARGAGNLVPPNATLYFRIELLMFR